MFAVDAVSLNYELFALLAASSLLRWIWAISLEDKQVVTK
jgi:hypothetical protein